jgi:hypothetical protein
MSNDIYTRLLAGESLDDIMNQFAEEANAAQARIAKEEEERKAREAEAARKKEQETAKLEDMRDLITEVCAYLALYYPSLGIDMDALDNDDLRVLAEVVVGVLDLETIKGTTLMRKTSKPTMKTAEDRIFKDFFKSFGL